MHSPELPSATKYVVRISTAGHRRLAMVNEDGTEQYEQPKEDLSYLQTMGEEEAAEAKVAPPNPEQAIELFQLAVGECDVILDLVRNLEEAKHLDYKIMQSKPRSAQAAMQQVTNTRMARAAGHRDALRKTAERLKAGAEALKLVAAQDNHFHAQVAQLQHYWSIRRAPPSLGMGPSVPYLADLSLGQLLPNKGGPTTTTTTTARGGATQAGTADAAAAAAGGPQTAFQRLSEQLSAVPLMRGPHGQLRVQLVHPAPPPSMPPSQSPAPAGAADNGAAPASTPATQAEQRRMARGRPAPGQEKQDVYVGLHAVHGALLVKQTEQLWGLLLDTVETESAQAAAGHANNYAMRWARLIADILAHQPHLADPLLCSLRPMLLEHTLTCRLAPTTVYNPRGAPPPPANSHRLLPDLVSVVAHACARAGMWQSLTQQVTQYSEVALQWVPSPRLCSSAARVVVGHMDACLVVMQDTSIGIDGVLVGHHNGTRWGNEGHTDVARHELPNLLSNVILGDLVKHRNHG